jgi:hypothetical protein
MTRGFLLVSPPPLLSVISDWRVWGHPETPQRSVLAGIRLRLPQNPSAAIATSDETYIDPKYSAGPRQQKCCVARACIVPLIASPSRQIHKSCHCTVDQFSG